MGGVDSPFYRQNLLSGSYPGFTPGLLHSSMGHTPFTPPSHIPTFTPKVTNTFLSQITSNFLMHLFINTLFIYIVVNQSLFILQQLTDPSKPTKSSVSKL